MEVVAAHRSRAAARRIEQVTQILDEALASGADPFDALTGMFARFADRDDAFWPFEGGTLELSGVFGGRPSLASSSATRAVSAATCATNVWISASFCSCESNERSGPADMDP